MRLRSGGDTVTATEARPTQTTRQCDEVTAAEAVPAQTTLPCGSPEPALRSVPYPIRKDEKEAPWEKCSVPAASKPSIVNELPLHSPSPRPAVPIAKRKTCLRALLSSSGSITLAESFKSKMKQVSSESKAATESSAKYKDVSRTEKTAQVNPGASHSVPTKTQNSTLPSSFPSCRAPLPRGEKAVEDVDLPAIPAQKLSLHRKPATTVWKPFPTLHTPSPAPVSKAVPSLPAPPPTPVSKPIPSLPTPPPNPAWTPVPLSPSLRPPLNPPSPSALLTKRKKNLPINISEVSSSSENDDIWMNDGPGTELRRLSKRVANNRTSRKKRRTGRQSIDEKDSGKEEDRKDTKKEESTKDSPSETYAAPDSAPASLRHSPNRFILKDGNASSFVYKFQNGLRSRLRNGICITRPFLAS